MPAYKFADRFVALVRSGAKNTTIRRHAAKPGELAQLYTDPAGLPGVHLGAGRIVSCLPVTLGWQDNGCPRVHLRSKRLNTALSDELARREGFATPREMVAWFEATYAARRYAACGGWDVYSGFLITWEPRPCP